jgi:hypothetical protein
MFLYLVFKNTSKITIRTYWKVIVPSNHIGDTRSQVIFLLPTISKKRMILAKWILKLKVYTFTWRKRNLEKHFTTGATIP